MTETKLSFGEETKPNSFDPENHFYPKTINTVINSIVSSFFHMGNKKIIDRYCHLNPFVKKERLHELLSYEPKFFRWSGGDLFNVVSETGTKKMVVIETNSCPSGQKSMPLLHENKEQGGYYDLIKHTFKPVHDEKFSKGELIKDGVLAVLYDKNEMEVSGYASVMADVFNETVYLVPFFKDDKNPCVKFVKLEGSKEEKKTEYVMELRDKNGKWHKVRACFRYLTQKPWNRIPALCTKTFFLNPIIACVAGGRNKLLAAKAYDELNSSISKDGIHLVVPKTVQDVSKKLVPSWIEKMGGYAVIKNPYSNAGQGVWTITSKEELKNFMDLKYEYDKYIVQALIGNYKWSSVIQNHVLYHVGTVPDKFGKIYVADLRMMIHYNYTTKGWSPLAVYARRALLPLETEKPQNSWNVLGTNLSYKNEDGTWGTSTKRLIVCAQNSFNQLGLGVDDLINGYIQTVLSTIAIDKLCCSLVKNGKFDLKSFNELNNDEALYKELLNSKFYD